MIIKLCSTLATSVLVLLLCIETSGEKNDEGKSDITPNTNEKRFPIRRNFQWHDVEDGNGKRLPNIDSGWYDSYEKRNEKRNRKRLRQKSKHSHANQYSGETKVKKLSKDQTTGTEKLPSISQVSEPNVNDLKTSIKTKDANFFQTFLENAGFSTKDEDDINVQKSKKDKSNKKHQTQKKFKTSRGYKSKKSFKNESTSKYKYPSFLGSYFDKDNGDLYDSQYKNQLYDASHVKSLLNNSDAKDFWITGSNNTSKYEDLVGPRVRGVSVSETSPLKEAVVQPVVQRDRRPNIIFIVTDDLDTELGSLNYMPMVRKHLKDAGATFSNAFTTTPVCCPSRSSMLTGMFIHNHEVYTNNHNCSSENWQKSHEKRTFATYIQNSGYRTGYIGKYLNRYKGHHIPPGWHEWVGLIKNSRYYNYTINKNNKFIKHGNRYPQDYFPHVITNEGLNFISKNSRNPFLLVLSHPSPHGPVDSAPEHAHKFFNATDHHTPSYNYAPNPDKQFVLQDQGRMTDQVLKFTDVLMTKRLQTLQTVDESVQKIVDKLQQHNILDNTFIFFSSDHGYHLGQFGLAKGKSTPFEFDIKVPFLVRGPGISPGLDLGNIALNVDLAPTFIDIAGLERPAQMDGRSILPLLKDEKKIRWRDSFLIESSGRLREEAEYERRHEKAMERTNGHDRVFQAFTSLLDGETIQNISLYTSKHERFNEVCMRPEFSYPCTRGQRWYCVKENYRWRIKKCRPHPSVWLKHCLCHWDDNLTKYGKLNPHERRKQRKFIKKHVNRDISLVEPKFLSTFNSVTPFVGLSAIRKRGRKKFKNQRYRRSTMDDVWNSLKLGSLLGTNQEGIQELGSYSYNEESDVLNEAYHEAEDLNDPQFDYSDGSENTEFRVNNNSFNLVDVGKGKIFDETSFKLNFNSQILDDKTSQAFVEEEELKDIEDQIHDISTELHDLESKTEVLPKNTSTTNEDIMDSHGCYATGGKIDCEQEVYKNFSYWRSSKATIEDQMRRLRQQLAVMKNIHRHLRNKRPTNHNIFNIYPDSFDLETKRVSSTDYFFPPLDYEDEKEGIEENLASDLEKSNIKSITFSERDDKIHNPSTGDYDIFTGRFYDIDEKRPSYAIGPRPNVDQRVASHPETNLENAKIDNIIRTHKNSHHRGRDRNVKLSNNVNHNEHDVSGRYKPNRLGNSGFNYGTPSFRYSGYLYPVPLSYLVGGTPNFKNEVYETPLCWCDERIVRRLEIEQQRTKRRQQKQHIKQTRTDRKRKHNNYRKKKRQETDCPEEILQINKCYIHDSLHWRTPPLWNDGTFCLCYNAANHTSWCLRTINETQNFLYCEFITGLITYYDLLIDPYQLRNVAFTLSSEHVQELHDRVNYLKGCKGPDQCDGFLATEQSPPKLIDDPKKVDLASSSLQLPTSDLPKHGPVSFFSRKRQKKIEKYKERKQRRKEKHEERRAKKLTKKWHEHMNQEMEPTIRRPRKSHKEDKNKRKKRLKEQKRTRKKRQRKMKKIKKKHHTKRKEKKHK